MYRCWISSAFRRGAPTAGLAALLICLAAHGAAAQEPIAAPEGPEVPVAAGEEERGLGRVLVLPTRATSDGGADAATFDVLLASALQEIGFQVVDLKQDPAVVRLDEEAPALERARELYLAMSLEEALAVATGARDDYLERHGALIAGEGLREAELFIVQLLLDLGRVTEALDMAVEVLVRHPQLRLDPVRYSPAMQALWLAAIERGADREPLEPGREALAELGREIGVGWVAAAVRKRTPDGSLWLAIVLVPVDDAESSSRHSIELGPRASWARDIRSALEERFPPPPPPPMPPDPDPGGEEPDPIVEKHPWYKSWWFWTLVGVVVVGGTAGGLGGYYSSKNETPEVTGDLWE